MCFYNLTTPWLNYLLSFCDARSHAKLYRTGKTMQTHYLYKTTKNVATGRVVLSFNNFYQRFYRAVGSALGKVVIRSVNLTGNLINSEVLKSLQALIYLDTILIRCKDFPEARQLCLSAWKPLLPNIKHLFLFDDNYIPTVSTNAALISSFVSRFPNLHSLNLSQFCVSDITILPAKRICLEGCSVDEVILTQKAICEELKMKFCNYGAAKTVTFDLTNSAAVTQINIPLSNLRENLSCMSNMAHLVRLQVDLGTENVNFTTFVDLVSNKYRSLQHLIIGNVANFFEIRGNNWCKFMIAPLEGNIYHIYTRIGYPNSVFSFHGGSATTRAHAPWDPAHQWKIDAVDGSLTDIVNVGTNLPLLPLILPKDKFILEQVGLDEYIITIAEHNLMVTCGRMSNLVFERKPEHKIYPVEISREDEVSMMHPFAKSLYASLPNLKTCQMLFDSTLSCKPIAYSRSGHYHDIPTVT